MCPTPQNYFFHETHIFKTTQNKLSTHYAEMPRSNIQALIQIDYKKHQHFHAQYHAIAVWYAYKSDY